MLTADSIYAIIPNEHSNQRNFKIYNETQDLVLVSIGEIIYINSTSKEKLEEIAKKLGITEPEYVDTKGRERMYDGFYGYLLKTNYKNMSGGVRSIKKMFLTNTRITQLLEIHH